MANRQISQLTAGTVGTTDVVVFQDAAGASEAKKATVQNILDLVPGGVQSVSQGTGITVDNTDPLNPIVSSTAIGTVLTEKISLTSADILALDGTPYTLIPAQGVGTFINVLKVYFQYNFVTTAYPDGGSIFTVFSSYFGLTVSNAIANVLNSSTTVFARPVIAAGVYITDSGYSNTPLLLCTTQQQTVGDGTLDVYITYDVITL